MNRDETTPLLGNNSLASSSSDQQLPPINQTAVRVASLNFDHLRLEDLVYDDRLHAQDRPTQVAFALAVLLHLRNTKRLPSESHDLYDRWLETKTSDHDTRVLEEQMVDIWTLFLTEYRHLRDIETVLWTRFPLHEGRSETFTVMELLADSSATTPLSSHPLFMSSLEHTWKHGLSIGLQSQGLTILERYDALSTPRILHTIDWIFHIFFLGLLAHYVLYPIEQPRVSDSRSEYNYGMREVFLALLPLAFVAQSRSFTNSSSLLTALAFLASFPFMPYPGSLSFGFLQCAVFLQPFALNSPQVPSHLFLLRQDRVLPLAFFLGKGLGRVLYAVILCFLPLLLFSTYLLSASLADAFIKMDAYLAFMSATPLDTRFTFLCLFFSVLASMVIATFVLSTSLPPSQDIRDPWSRYSVESGQLARRAFTRATMFYTRPYTFPPPFNLIYMLIVMFPRRVMKLILTDPPSLARTERMLWRLIVGPLTAFFTIFFWRST